MNRIKHPLEQASPSQLFAATAFSLAMASTWGSAYAQEPEERRSGQLPGISVEADREKPYKPERLSSPKRTQPLLDTPQSVTVISEDVFDEQGASSLRDVFRNIPGISIEAGEGNPGSGDQLSLRGFSASDDIFLDGVRSVGNISRDPFNLEAVEVIKGPSSAFAGRGSSGGAINLVTKTPRAEQFGEFELTGGTESTLRGTADYNQPLDSFGMANAALRFNALYHDSEVADRDEVENQRWGLAPSLAFGLGTDTRVTLSYSYEEHDNTPDQGIPNVRDDEFADSPFLGGVAPVDFSNFYGYTQRDLEDLDQSVATLLFEQDVNDNFRVRNQTRYQRVNIDAIFSSPRLETNLNDPDSTFTGQIDETTRARGSSRPRNQTDEITSNQTDLTFNFATGGLAHTLVTGLEFGRQELENRRRTEANGPFVNLFDPNPNIDVAPDQIGDRIAVTVFAESDFVGAYVSDTIELNDQWQLNGTVRVDYIDTRVRGVDNDPTDPDRSADESRDDTEFSGNAAVVYKPVSNGSIYFGYGTSFTPLLSSGTSDSGVFQPAGGGPQGGGVIEDGFDADPERSQTFELGTKWDLFDARLALNAAIFRTEKTDARNINPLDKDIVTVNGEERIDGFEIGVNGAITDNWRVLAAYTYLDGEVLESDVMEFSANGPVPQEGMSTENTPEHSASLWTTYRLPYNLSVGIGAQYVDERTIFQDRPDRAAVTVDDFLRFDAVAAWQASNNLGFRLNVFNFTDEEYIQSINSAQSIPGAGPSATLSALYSLN